MRVVAALLASAPTVPDSWIIAINVAKVLVAMASLVLAIFIALNLRKRQRLLNETVREIADDQPFVTLPDHGQTITVYAKKSRVVLYIIQLTLVAGVSTAAGVWMWSDPRYQMGAVLAALFDLLLAPFLLLAIVRLISHSPVLIVNTEGITDNATFIATGFGLIRWCEIRGLYIYTPERLGFQMKWSSYLTILADDDTIRRRQPLWKRAFVTITTPASDGVRIYQFLLPMPLEELRAQIKEHLRAHRHKLPFAAAPANADTSTNAD